MKPIQFSGMVADIMFCVAAYCLGGTTALGYTALVLGILFYVTAALTVGKR